MNSRQLKVSYRPTQSHVPLRMPSPMPFLRLQGRWLDRAGFAVGANVHVQVEPGRLVLEVIDPQAETG
jgi:Toxin SymE, type I toxin-antitoxin system